MTHNDVSGVDPRPVTGPTRSLFVRTGLMTGAVVLIALLLFIALILPMQHRMLVDRLESTAQVMATSIDQITVTSIVVEDYSPVIEHCMKVVQERPSVSYITITRRDGFSLVHTAGGWRYDRQSNPQPDAADARGWFRDIEGGEERVYHYAYPLSYSGIDWGWIQIGLSLDGFTRDQRETYTRIAILGAVSLIVASLVSLFFARRLTRPIHHLNEVSRQVAAGNLAARASVTTGDDVERLSESFNQMTRNLQVAQAELEQRVSERTAELLAANEDLRAEIAERLRAEAAQLGAERELEAQRAVSLRSDRLRSLGEMAAGIAHELNQPLMGVRGLAEHIVIGQERGWDLDEAELNDCMQRILDQADRMVHIIQHVRMFAREAGRPEVTPVDVNEVVDSAVDLLKMQFRSHGLELRVEAGDQLPQVLANPYSLEEVVLNLLNNARDAMEAEEGDNKMVHVRTLQVAAPEGDSVCVEVRDNGSGISPESLPHVFDPFFSTKDPTKGTGLGLAVSRSIVEEIGGKLSLTTQEGKGTTALIELPVEATANAIS